MRRSADPPSQIDADFGSQRRSGIQQDDRTVGLQRETIDMPATRLRIFISSVQKEFAQVRRDLRAFLLGDAVLQRFVAEVFLFEELPAKDRRADEVYIGEVERCDIYLGIFGYEYGFEDENGVSPTEHEYDHATRHGKTRLVYVWGSNDKKRAPKMRKLVHKASAELIRRRVDDVSALTAEVNAHVSSCLNQLIFRLIRYYSALPIAKPWPRYFVGRSGFIG